MDVGAAELLGGHLLAGGRLHERRAADEDRAGAADDDRLVRHGRHVGAAGRARAHHDGDLRDALRGHAGLVVEDPAEVVAVGEDLVLQRQEGAARVDEVDARQVVLLRDLLGAEVLLHREREVRAALHGGVVRDDHARATLDDPDPRDDPRRRRLPVVEVPGREGVQLEERRAGVDEPVDPLPRRQLAAGAVALERLLAAAGRDECRALAELVDERLHPRGAPLERLVARDMRREHRHAVSNVTRTAPDRHLVSDADVDRSNAGVVRRRHDLLHLHRLEDDERLVRLDGIALLDADLDHLARHRRHDAPVADGAGGAGARGRLDLERREASAREAG